MGIPHVKSSCQENTKKKKNPNPLNSKIDTSLQVISQNPDHIHPNNLFIHSDWTCSIGQKCELIHLCQ